MPIIKNENRNFIQTKGANFDNVLKKEIAIVSLCQPQELHWQRTNLLSLPKISEIPWKVIWNTLPAFSSRLNITVTFSIMKNFISVSSFGRCCWLCIYYYYLFFVIYSPGREIPARTIYAQNCSILSGICVMAAIENKCVESRTAKPYSSGVQWQRERQRQRGKKRERYKEGGKETVACGLVYLNC